jgi:putative transposase
LTATYLTVREAGRTGALALIVAVGLNTDGRREVLGVATGASEAEPYWKAFLLTLADRGLRRVKLVVADDHKERRAAAAMVFSGTHQRCRVRWLRNAVAHVPPKQRPAAVSMPRTIFAQDTADADQAQWQEVADPLRERFPRLAALINGARDAVLAHMTVPLEHCPQIACTNPLERLNGEIKRRADVIGILPNDRSAVRLVGAVILEQCDEWAVSRRYIRLEALAALSDDPFLRLSAAAA